MVAVLRYAKDLKPGDRFRYKGNEWIAREVRAITERCTACDCTTVPKVRIDLEGVSLTLFPREAVEMVEVVDTYQAKREKLSTSIARGE